MAVDVEQMKAAVRIEDVIGAEMPLRGGGRWLRAEQHDSLVVDTHGQCYFWNSRDEQGDVVSWVMARKRCDFRAAVEWLARLAGLPEPQWGEQDAQAAQERRQRYDVLTIAGRHFVRCLRNNEAALSYCYSRGWSDETIQQAGLGYADGDLEALRGEFSMHEVAADDAVAKAMLGIHGKMLVYAHVAGGRVLYVSARSIEGKRHYNPPRDLVGDRCVYANWEYSPQAEQVAVTEGQADAITFGQWGIPAIALAGVAMDQALLKQLARHDQIYVALDQDEAGVKATRTIASALGPLTHVVKWPEDIQDANDWLQQGEPGLEDVRARLAAASTWVELLAAESTTTQNSQRLDALRRVFRLIARMDEFSRAMYREKLAGLMGLGLREYGTMLKVAVGEGPGEGEAEAEPLITIETVGGMIAETLCELIYEPPPGSGIGMGHGIGGGKTLFAVRRPDGTIETAKYVDHDGVRYWPINPENRILSERVVQFPSGLGKSMTMRELIKWIQGTINKYVDVDIFYEALSAYYVLFTWLYDCFNTVPYLRSLGDAGTGKSRLIQVVGAMCYRPTYVSGAATTSPIFRILDRYRGTLVLDEADFGKSDEAADIVKILNTGYQRTQGTVLRSGDRNTGFEPEVFVVYGPKLVATRKRFQDWALESRCLTKEMGGPTTRADIPIDLAMSFWTEEAPQIRNALLRLRMEKWQPQIELDYTGMDMSIEPRLNQVTVALLTLIKDEDLREDLRGFIREYNRQLVVERGMTVEAKTLEVLVALNEMGSDADLKLTTIAERVNWLIDWDNHGEEMIGYYTGAVRRQGKSITPKRIGAVVRNTLHMRTERGKDLGRGYRVVWNDARIEGLRKRFGADDELVVNTLGVLFEIEARITEAKAREPDQEEMGF